MQRYAVTVFALLGSWLFALTGSASHTYVQVQWAASWQFGFPETGWSSAPNTFVITPMAPRVAQAYLPTLAFLGQR